MPRYNPSRDREQNADDHDGVLADPTHAGTFELLKALNTLDDEAKVEWIADHPEAKAQIESDLQAFLDSIKGAMEAFSEGLREAFNSTEEDRAE